MFLWLDHMPSLTKSLTRACRFGSVLDSFLLWSFDRWLLCGIAVMPCSESRCGVGVTLWLGVSDCVDSDIRPCIAATSELVGEALED